MGKRDLITKDFALYVVHYFASMQTWSKDEILSGINRTIKEAKEDIVRCKDCVWWGARGHLGTIGRCESSHNGLWNEYTYACDFCSYGERKEK